MPLSVYNKDAMIGNASIGGRDITLGLSKPEHRELLFLIVRNNRTVCIKDNAVVKEINKDEGRN
jgi:hypothetical protein